MNYPRDWLSGEPEYHKLNNVANESIEAAILTQKRKRA
jgi:hypothetical protein